MSTPDDDLATRLRHSLDRGAAPDLSSDVITGAADRSTPRIITPARRLQLVGGASALVAVAVIGGIAFGSTTPRAPLFTAAANGPASGSRSSLDASRDMRIGVWVDYRYSAGAGLTTSGGTGRVYQLERSGMPENRAAEIATAFGVSGTAVKAEYSDPAYPTWIVGATDTSAPSVYVTWAGAGDWWYSDPGARPASGCEPGATTAEAACSSSAAAPTESEARARARALFATTGFDVAERDLRVTADASQTTVTANLIVDGVETALDWGVSWSSTGAISSAYGHSMKVVDRGSYDTISAVAAVDRLAGGRWYGAAGPAYQGDASALAAGSARAIEPPVEPAPSGDPQVDPPAQPTPTPVEVTVEKGETTLVLLWDSAGNSWLVPGFALKAAEGWWTSVVSLVPGVIELAQPIPYSPDTIDVPTSTP